MIEPCLEVVYSYPIPDWVYGIIPFIIIVGLFKWATRFKPAYTIQKRGEKKKLRIR